MEETVAQKREDKEMETKSMEGKEGTEMDMAKEMGKMPFETLCSMNDRMCSGLRTYNEEMLRLMNQQIELNLKLAGQLVQCKTPQNVTEACTEFMQTALKQNIKQAERMMQICTEMADEMMKDAASK